MMNNYKYKMYKYKLKYYALKKQLAGSVFTDEYNNFINKVNNIYNLVKEKYGNELILTGSAALYYILIIENQNKILETLEKPKDIDLLYTGDHGSNLINYGTYEKDNKTADLIKSVTYVNSLDPNDKFDLTRIDKIKFNLINGINIIDLNELLRFYNDDRLESQITIKNPKILALENIIDIFSQNEELCKKYNLYKETKEITKGKPLFEDSDDESPSLSRSLFSFIK